MERMTHHSDLPPQAAVVPAERGVARERAQQPAERAAGHGGQAQREHGVEAEGQLGAQGLEVDAGEPAQARREAGRAGHGGSGQVEAPAHGAQLQEAVPGQAGLVGGGGVGRGGGAGGAGRGWWGGGGDGGGGAEGGRASWLLEALTLCVWVDGAGACERWDEGLWFRVEGAASRGKSQASSQGLARPKDGPG